nr:MAG TPA: hypothetical protein [Caudoviricetes sp.]
MLWDFTRPIPVGRSLTALNSSPNWCRGDYIPISEEKVNGVCVLSKMLKTGQR